MSRDVAVSGDARLTLRTGRGTSLRETSGCAGTGAAIASGCCVADRAGKVRTLS
jgi:hypothetical protein